MNNIATIIMVLLLLPASIIAVHPEFLQKSNLYQQTRIVKECKTAQPTPAMIHHTLTHFPQSQLKSCKDTLKYVGALTAISLILTAPAAIAIYNEVL